MSSQTQKQKSEPTTSSKLSKRRHLLKTLNIIQSHVKRNKYRYGTALSVVGAGLHLENKRLKKEIKESNERIKQEIKQDKQEKQEKQKRIIYLNAITPKNKSGIYIFNYSQRQIDNINKIHSGNIIKFSDDYEDMIIARFKKKDSPKYKSNTYFFSFKSSHYDYDIFCDKQKKKIIICIKLVVA